MSALDHTLATNDPLCCWILVLGAVWNCQLASTVTWIATGCIFLILRFDETAMWRRSYDGVSLFCVRLTLVSEATIFWFVVLLLAYVNACSQTFALPVLLKDLVGAVVASINSKFNRYIFNWWAKKTEKLEKPEEAKLNDWAQKMFSGSETWPIENEIKSSVFCADLQKQWQSWYKLYIKQDSKA